MSESTACFCCNSEESFLNDTFFRCKICSTINDLSPIETPILEGPFGFNPPLSLNKLQRLISICERKASHIPLSTKTPQLCANQYKPVESLIEATFSNLDSLSNSFSDGQNSTASWSGIAQKEVREGFKLIINLPAPIIRSMMLATSRLLRRPGRPFTRKRDIKWLFILLENPLLAQNHFKEETSVHHELLCRIFGFISCLNSQLKKCLVNWFSKLPSKTFQRRISLVHNCLSQCLKGCLETFSPYQLDWKVKSCSVVMGLLFSAYTICPSVEIASFYNGDVGELELADDYDAWQLRSRYFSFCQYPFLISLNAKLKIMELDAQRQMESMLKGVIHGIMLDQATEPFFLALSVRRDFIVQDSLDQLSCRKSELKKKLCVSFVGEEGVDAGGLTKEWSMILVNELFDPVYGMFTQEEESQLFWFTSTSFESNNQYYLVGIVIGLAIYNSIILDIQLPIACFKKLLELPVSLDDLKQLRPSVARSLQKILDYPHSDVESVFGLSFEIQYEAYGSLMTWPLIPGGSSISVTSENKKDFVNRYVTFVLSESIKRQFEPFKKGFLLVCGGNALTLFRPEEIELLVRGSPDPFTIDQLMSASQYDGFHPEESTIRFFWYTLELFDLVRRKRFLAFVTGSSRIPACGITGFGLKISCLGEDGDSLPVTHTCFNQICFPRYSTQKKLQTKLLQALDECSGFELN